MKRSRFFRQWIILFFVLTCLCGNVFADGEKSIITIESAQKTEYRKDKEKNQDTIVLSGNVKISVERGKTKTAITADLVNYNRANDMLFAEGNVSLVQSSGGSGGGETITAKSLLFNTATLEGIFDNGRAVQTSSDAINLPSGSTLNVASEIFGRDSGGTIAFKTGELTFCDDEDPHWKIKASRIWLLPGGEFAFLNARLYVGRVPVMYFPAFYYPKDELLFNPAFGYKNREGYFINTTTYIYGRKNPDSAVSTKSSDSDDDKIDFFSFMKTGGMKEQVREGLILHNLDDDYGGDTSSWFKIMGDYYSNLGYMVGFDGSFRPGSIITSLDTNLELGFSNTVYNKNGLYTPYDASASAHKDGSNFMSFSAPFRYQANLKMTIARPFNLNLSLPIYSDPHFDWDFNQRVESMDWIDYMMSGGVSEQDENDATSISSFNWNLNGNYTFKIPEFLNPFISSMSVSSFSSSILYSSKSTSRADIPDTSPERSFYYPSQVTPFKIAGRISGKIFQYPFKTKNTKNTEMNHALTLNIPEALDDSEKKAETEEKTASPESDAQKSAENESEEQIVHYDESTLPVIQTPAFSSQKVAGITYNLDYSVSPDYSSQITYSSTKLNSPDDFKWSEMQSTYFNVSAPATLTSSLGYRDSFLSLTDTFNFNPVYQKHPYLNDDESKGGYSASSIKSIKNSDHNAYKMDLTDTNSLSFRPFIYTKYFANTSLSWNTTVKMIRTKYISDDPENPEWEYLTTDLTDDECVTSHNLNLNIAATEDKYSQSLSLSTTLYPQVDSYSGTLNLGFPYASFSAGTGIKKKSKTDDTWVKQNLSQSFSVRLFESRLSLSQSYVHNMENKENDSLRFSMSGYGAQLAYTMSNTNGYTFNSGSGWSSTTKKEFQPYNLSLAYTNPSKTFKYWSDRISWTPTVSTSVVYDCLRPTSSYFVFKPGVTFKVNNFLDFSFSAETRNSVIYRYFCPENKYQEYYKGTGERSIFNDLMNSFRFDDEQKRLRSGFKMKSFNMTVTHDLDDWDLNCTFKMAPRLVNDSGKSEYRYDPYFTISVAWRPMAGMKTEIKDDYGEWMLNK